jgi:hypothetical protein
MKKILSYLIIMTAGGLFAACSLNDAPEFDDANAFVAFEKTAISVDENAGTLRVGVRLTSLGGLTSTVAYQVFNGTAQEDVDFEPTGGSSVLTFSAETPVQYIEFNILEHPGLFTGDRSFGIKLTNGGDVALGAADSTAVTVLDLDHPLSFMLGNYTVYGPNYFGGRADTWEVTIEKDPDGDVAKVWISNLVVAGTSEKVYGIVNEDKNKIEIPVGQTIAVAASYDSVVLEGFDDPDINEAGLLPTGSKITMSLTQESPVKFTMDLPFGSHILDIDSWYSIVLAGAVFTKQ